MALFWQLAVVAWWYEAAEPKTEKEMTTTTKHHTIDALGRWVCT